MRSYVSRSVVAALAVLSTASLALAVNFNSDFQQVYAQNMTSAVEPFAISETA
jgi:hypothetical protein